MVEHVRYKKVLNGLIDFFFLFCVLGLHAIKRMMWIFLRFGDRVDGFVRHITFCLCTE